MLGKVIEIEQSYNEETKDNEYRILVDEALVPTISRRLVESYSNDILVLFKIIKKL